MQHCELIQAGELQAIVGDTARNGVGGPQYCGLWSLTSSHWPFNAFGNSYAGLLPGELRGRPCRVEPVDEATCRLARAADARHPVDAVATYTVRPPHAVDHVLRFRDRRDARAAGCPYREVSWCCYMNCPDDPRLHFLSGGQWFRYASPRHGVGSSIAPAYVADEELEVRPPVAGQRPFHWDRIAARFDAPFYYGRLGPMVLLLIFDRPRWLRFFCSPSGGGHGLAPGSSCPAWDFEWIVPAAAYAVDRELELRLRLVYKPFVSDEDVIAAVHRAQDELGFEKVGGSSGF